MQNLVKAMIANDEAKALMLAYEILLSVDGKALEHYAKSNIEETRYIVSELNSGLGAANKQRFTPADRQVMANAFPEAKSFWLNDEGLDVSGPMQNQSQASELLG